MSEEMKMQQPNAGEYDYDLDLNWRDDGDELTEPCINDFNKGYQVHPYDFVQWAKKNNKNIKTAAQEVINMHYYPEFLADYILTLWNGVDGSLQDFYDGFVLRYNNNMKKSIADEFGKRGYKVLPVLTDDRAFYASKFNKCLENVSKKSLEEKLEFARKAFKNSEALQLCLGEIDDIKEMGSEVSQSKVSDLLDYYSQIFPEDYALGLTNNLVNDKIQDIDKNDYRDFNITNESLTSLERMLSEDQNPFDAPYDGGGNLGYDYISDMRGFDGVRPEQFEM